MGCRRWGVRGEHVNAGILMTYGINQVDIYRQAGVYVGRILNGDKPASLPIMQTHCRARLLRLRGKAGKEYFHAMLGATLVAPGHDKVVPLQPEFIVPQDGAEKQDCENAAAKRWLDAHAAGYARLNPIYLGDDLFSRQPLCEAVLAAGSHFIFVCKPSSHP